MLLHTGTFLGQGLYTATLLLFDAGMNQVQYLYFPHYPRTKTMSLGSGISDFI